MKELDKEKALRDFFRRQIADKNSKINKLTYYKV